MAGGGVRGIPEYRRQKRKEYENKSIEELEEKLKELKNRNTEYYSETNKMGIMAEKDVLEELIEHKRSKGLDKAEKHLDEAFQELRKCREWIETARDYIEEERQDDMMTSENIKKGKKND